MNQRRLKSLLLTVVLVVGSVLTATAQDYRDVVFLKNGSVLKGWFDEYYPDDSLRLRTIDGGVLVCATSDIERIAKEKNSVYLVDVSKSYKHDVSEWRRKGYRGMVDLGYNINIDDSHMKISSLTTTHGYQFNKYFFLGAGIGLSQMTYKMEDKTVVFNDNYSFSVFADARVYLLKRNITPVIVGRGGYDITGFKQWFANPSVGVDFSFSPRFGIYVLVGYYYEKYNLDDELKTMHGLAFNAGIHF